MSFRFFNIAGAFVPKQEVKNRAEPGGAADDPGKQCPG